MIFAALIIPDFLGRNFQQFRMHKVVLYIRKKSRIMRTGTDTLICRNTNRQKALHARFTIFDNCNTFRHPHSEKQSNIPPVVQMVIHIVQSDGSSISDIHTHIERKLFHQNSRSQAITVQETYN